MTTILKMTSSNEKNSSNRTCWFPPHVKFRYSEEAKTNCPHPPLFVLHYLLASKFKWKMGQMFVAFSEYLNFTIVQWGQSFYEVAFGNFYFDGNVHKWCPILQSHSWPPYLPSPTFFTLYCLIVLGSFWITYLSLNWMSFMYIPNAVFPRDILLNNNSYIRTNRVHY